MKINIEELKKRKDYINCRKHPELDFLIWNYNNSCQFDRAWDKYTKMARGLITDLEGSVIAKPFSKFFNLGEQEETMEKNLPNEIPEVTEKVDGSLGVQYTDGKEIYISTRGSFESDQAKWATEWIQKRFTVEDFKSGYTYLFEIIY